ncbi:hypothetical protein HPP92_013790 [Vanilla planifolia]|uniref:Fatty acid desaturase domain-containing protein n=1 Tax=Vanilla planifolia TaxID=51239 RepID=A0A835UV44_VANPL|nr:hypothetical protein HPP92_013790 [Vanilla planifolia]
MDMRKSFLVSLWKGLFKELGDQIAFFWILCSKFLEWSYLEEVDKLIAIMDGSTNIHHDIGTHVIHHLFPHIPHYHLVEAVSSNYSTALLCSEHLDLMVRSTSCHVSSYTTDGGRLSCPWKILLRASEIRTAAISPSPSFIKEHEA